MLMIHKKTEKRQKEAGCAIELRQKFEPCIAPEQQRVGTYHCFIIPAL